MLRALPTDHPEKPARTAREACVPPGMCRFEGDGSADRFRILRTGAVGLAPRAPGRRATVGEIREQWAGRP
ncbi:hypothetical protein ACWD5Q_30725 [Streptomyces sp. NPDC002513]